MLSNRRISLECPVVDAKDLQGWVGSFTLGTAADLKPYDDYHLTVLHLGKTDEIFETVRMHVDARSRPLSEAQFLGQLQAWLRVHVRTLRHSVDVGVNRLATLGQQAPYALVCRVTTLPLELSDLHESLLTSFGRLLEEDFGVPDGLGLVRSSPIFGFSGKEWVPHVTVGNVRRPVELDLPPRTVRLGPMKVRNGESLGIYGSEPL